MKQEIEKSDQQIQVNFLKTVIQVNELKQFLTCQAIAFDKAGTLMVANCEKTIKVWQFNKGKLIAIKTLVGHIDSITCLVFSKNLNWFASSSDDLTIRSWIEQENDWVSVQSQNKHSCYINCLILNSQENELISCGSDQMIIVWKVDCWGNQLKYNYTLEKKHSLSVYSISLNFSETALVSCSADETIILWVKGQNQKWEYTNHIEVSYGYRICFISDTQILFQPCSINQTQIFSVQNQKLEELQNLKINLNRADDDFHYFPTVFNKKMQLIIQKHNKYVYLIQRQIDGSFKIVLEPIDCLSMFNYGSLTEDGEYLVIWNQETKEFKVHQILY